MPAPSPCWQLAYPQRDIACLSWQTPTEPCDPAMADALQQLDRQLDLWAAKPQLAGLILVLGQSSRCVAAAEPASPPRNVPPAVAEWIAGGPAVLARLAAAPFVCVAAIDGACLGEAAELACWCDRRVATDSASTRWGFPQVQLGLVPTWGATARLPRITSPAVAIDLLTTGRTLDAAAAHQIGLTDEPVPAERLIETAIAAIRQEQQSGRLPERRERMSQPLPSADGVQSLADRAAAALATSRSGWQTAALTILQLLRESIQIHAAAACGQAAAAYRQLCGSPQQLALTNVFHLRRRSRQVAAVPAARPLEGPRQLGIVGAGTMGIGVAAVCIRRGIPVRLADASAEAVKRAMAAVAGEVAVGSPPAAAAGPAALTAADSWQALTDCDLVLETIVENAEVKRRLYQQLEPYLSPEAVLASNTSTISISSLASRLQRPERFCGLHFFSPVNRTRLVEIVRGDRTSEPTVAAALALVAQLGRMPIVVRDGPGFLVNRLLAPYLNESLELLCAGASIEQIDGAAEQFGMSLGPLALYDLIGIDTSFYAGRTMWEAFPQRIAALPVLPALMRRGRLGQKTGAGFYRYDGTMPPQPDPAAAALVEAYVRRKREFSEDEIRQRLLLPVVLEATRVLAEGIVQDARDVDLGMVDALGFPACRGGLLFWADTLGAAEIVGMLQPYRALGPRFEPTDLLLEMARAGGRFYDPVARRHS